MRKILFLGVLFTLLSCDNDNLESINSDAKTNQILELKSENEQKLAYSLLNPEEKAIIWTKHLNSMKLLNSYNEEQINFINEIQKSFTAIYFSNKTKSKDSFNKKVISKGLKIFSKKELYYLVASLSTYSKLPGQGGPPPISTCGCSTSSDWCFSGNCNGTAYCLRDSDNCGTGWSYTCNGDCA
jgi:hypothetical protein